MLSLENAASGTNLTEATHIVLMDPVAGTPAKAVSVEQQAIGRAHRMGQNKQVSMGCHFPEKFGISKKMKIVKKVRD